MKDRNQNSEQLLIQYNCQFQNYNSNQGQSPKRGYQDILKQRESPNIDQGIYLMNRSQSPPKKETQNLQPKRIKQYNLSLESNNEIQKKQSLSSSQPKKRPSISNCSFLDKNKKQNREYLPFYFSPVKNNKNHNTQPKINIKLSNNTIYCLDNYESNNNQNYVSDQQNNFYVKQQIKSSQYYNQSPKQLSILKNPIEYKKLINDTFGLVNNSDKNPNQNKFIVEPPVQPQIQKIQYNQDRRIRVFNLLNDLYGKTSELRFVEEQFKYYVRSIEDLKSLNKYYGLKLQDQKFISQICNSFIVARGDGNCFYTAFGFQFLYHLICTYSEEKFQNFIDDLLNLKFKIRMKYAEYEIKDSNNNVKDIIEEFIYIIQDLRQVEEQQRFIKLHESFAQFKINIDGTAFLYGLQTIILRNLSDYYLDKSDYKDSVYDRENLLIWETECNTNEVIIQILAQQLKIHVKFLFISPELQLKEYEQQNQDVIILLFQPGHYNIGWNLIQ